MYCPDIASPGRRMAAQAPCVPPGYLVSAFPNAATAPPATTASWKTSFLECGAAGAALRMPFQRRPRFRDVQHIQFQRSYRRRPVRYPRRDQRLTSVRLRWQRLRFLDRLGRIDVVRNSQPSRICRDPSENSLNLSRRARLRLARRSRIDTAECHGSPFSQRSMSRSSVHILHPPWPLVAPSSHPRRTVEHFLRFSRSKARLRVLMAHETAATSIERAAPAAGFMRTDASAGRHRGRWRGGGRSPPSSSFPDGGSLTAFAGTPRPSDRSKCRWAPAL